MKMNLQRAVDTTKGFIGNYLKKANFLGETHGEPHMVLEEVSSVSDTDIKVVFKITQYVSTTDREIRHHGLAAVEELCDTFPAVKEYNIIQEFISR